MCDFDLLYWELKSEIERQPARSYSSKIPSAHTIFNLLILPPHVFRLTFQRDHAKSFPSILHRETPRKSWLINLADVSEEDQSYRPDHKLAMQYFRPAAEQRMF